MFVKKNWLPLLFAFFLPILIMGVVYATQGVWWGGPNTILAGDGYHQYVASHSLYSRILHQIGKLGFFYTWTSGLGLNLYAFSSYYMGSFFMPLTFFFDPKTMPDGMYLIALLKFGGIGLSSFVSFRHMYIRVNRWLVLALSLAFTLMSYTTSQSEITMWLDAFILIPLIMWGLHQLLHQERRLLYFISLTFLFIQNYYFGFMIAIFVSLYALARLFGTGWSWSRLIDFILTSLLSGLSASFLILPMYLDLRANGQDFSPIQKLWTDHSWVLDFFAKNFTGAYDTTQFGAIPMIYAGLLPLFLLPFFFLLRLIPWRLKVGMGLVFALILLAFYFEPLDLFWQGMHTPNMFLHRYSFVLSLLMIILAFEVLSYLRFWHLSHWIISGFILAAGFSATLLSNHYDFLLRGQILLTGLFFLATLLLIFSSIRSYLPLRWVAIPLFILSTVDMSVNAYYQNQGIAEEWHYPGRADYNSQADWMMGIAKKISKLSGDELVRADSTNPDTANDSIKFGWNAISQFSSVRNSNSSATMSDLGFQTDGDYLNLRYPANTLLMDSIFAIKYNINQNQPPKFGYGPAGSGYADLTTNTFAQPLGIFVPGGFTDAVFLNKTDTIHNQTLFVNQLTHSNQTFYHPIFGLRTGISGSLSEFAGQVTLSKPARTPTPISIDYQLTVPADTQAYVQIPNLTFGNSEADSMTIDTGYSTYSIPTKNSGNLFNLGSFENSTQLTLHLSFTNTDAVTFFNPQFWALDLSAYRQAMNRLASTPVTVREKADGLELTYEANQSGDIFLSVPYDKGWIAKLDGHPIKYKQAQGGFIKIRLPEGRHKVRMSFLPQGLKTGIIISLLGLVGFFLYFSYRKKSSFSNTRPSRT